MMEGCSSGNYNYFTKKTCLEPVDIFHNGGDLHRRDFFGNTPLHNELLHGGSLEVIEWLLDKHGDVNDTGFFRYSLLQLSVLRHMHPNFITKLIRLGADLNHKDLSGQTALHMVVRIGSSKQILQLLLDNGADLYAKDVRGQTPLHFASSIESVIVLLINGASVFKQDSMGQTPLHCALWPKNPYHLRYELEIAEVLLDHGKDRITNVKDARGRTPVHLIAMLHNDNNILTKMLYLYNGSMGILDNDGNSPVDLAVNNPRNMMIFTQRALKLKCANLPVEVNLEFDFRYSAFEHETYLKELHMMKLYKFGKFSLYDIFSKSNDPAFLNNEEIAEGMQTAVESPYLEKEFPSYGYILKEIFCKKQKRMHLLNVALEISGVLPEEMKREVLSYLSDHDLENWITAQI